MGLDMYAYAIDKGFDAQTDMPRGALEGHRLIAQWRKHPNLHGWMAQRYYEKGGKSDQFNCSPLRLERDDLVELRKAIRDRDLPETWGFFFGESTGEEIDEDLAFVDLALRMIDQGYAIVYDSWW